MEFEDWARTWFDRPEDWSASAADDLPCDISGREALAFASRLFSNAPSILAPFSKAQIGHGLWGIISEGQDSLLGLLDPAIDQGIRVQCVEAIEHVYTGVFAPRCDEALGHLNEAPTPLNTTCYMWWDIFVAGPTTALTPTVLSVMKRALSLPHAACQESALHGLGHWRNACPDDVDRIITDFLKDGRARRPELIPYARQAMLGMVQ